MRVQPRASRDELVGWRGETLRIRVTAAPEEGRANRAVTALLSRALAIAPSSIALLRGAAARDKVFRVAGLSAGAIRARLGGLGA